MYFEVLLFLVKNVLIESMFRFSFVSNLIFIFSFGNLSVETNDMDE